MYIMPEPDGKWKPEAVTTLLNIFNVTKCFMVNPRKKLEDRYIGCLYSDTFDISRRLKAAGVVNEYNSG